MEGEAKEKVEENRGRGKSRDPGLLCRQQPPRAGGWAGRRRARRGERRPHGGFGLFSGSHAGPAPLGQRPEARTSRRAAGARKRRGARPTSAPTRALGETGRFFPDARGDADRARIRPAPDTGGDEPRRPARAEHSRRSTAVSRPPWRRRRRDLPSSREWWSARRRDRAPPPRPAARRGLPSQAVRYGERARSLPSPNERAFLAKAD